MNDSISRRAAIDAICALPMYFDDNDIRCVDFDDVISVLREHLPPSRPEPCEDAVSREAVIDSVRQDCFAVFTADEREYEIRDLPLVTPKQRTGYWIKRTNTLYKCDRCGAVQLKGNYCKDCGAKMEGVNNEND